MKELLKRSVLTAGKIKLCPRSPKDLCLLEGQQLD